MSAPVPSDPAMLRVLANYLRDLDGHGPRLRMCADALDRVAEGIQLAQDDHDASRRELSAVEAIAQDVLRDLPTWLTRPHGVQL